VEYNILAQYAFLQNYNYLSYAKILIHLNWIKLRLVLLLVVLLVKEVVDLGNVVEVVVFVPVVEDFVKVAVVIVLADVSALNIHETDASIRNIRSLSRTGME
jgi:hypothetical protein